MIPVGADPWTPTRLRRTSDESVISVELAAPGVDEVRVTLPDALIAHGVESFAAWAGFTLRMIGEGGDRHHVVEDAALTLGRALRSSLGDQPRARIGGSLVPMDDALVQIALDLSDRPFAALDSTLPPLVRHFFRSLSDEARWTLHVRVVAGEDEHHLVEASFKGLGLALAQAASPQPRGRSRKGRVQWQDGPEW